MIYPYICEKTGETLEIVRPMSNPPKWTVRRKGKTFRRVVDLASVSIVVKSDGAVRHPGRKLPISFALPKADPFDPASGARETQMDGHKVFQLKDGTHCTPTGHRIVDNNRTADRLGKSLDYARDN